MPTGPDKSAAGASNYRDFLAKQFQQMVAPSFQPAQTLPTIDHADQLDDIVEMPPYLMPCHEHGHPRSGRYSCSFCGVGDSGAIVSQSTTTTSTSAPLPIGTGHVELLRNQKALSLTAHVQAGDQITIETNHPLVPPGAVLNATLHIQGQTIPILAREFNRHSEGKNIVSQSFIRYAPSISTAKSQIKETKPTGGCAKLKLSLIKQKPAFPIHTAPSILDPETGERRSITYQEGINRLVDLMLAHRAPHNRTLIYASGQLDYFTIFAMQEVYRLLGIRNMTGNAEHCLNSGAVHNQTLTGQEGPFLTIEQSLAGPNRFFILNGWNGYITHPPVFHKMTKRADFDGYMIEVMVTESAKIVASKLGPDRILLIKSSSDPHLALGIANEILNKYPQAIEQRFIDKFSDKASYDAYVQLAKNEYFEPKWVAQRIAPEPKYEQRLIKGMQDIALKIVQPGFVPINLPSVGLSQTSGIVAHCLWGNLLAMVGKYGLNPDGTPAGGTLRVPGQINAESEVQGLSRNYYMGRLPVDKYASEVCRRMGLPDDGYDKLFEDTPRAALDYSDPTPGVRELFLCFGTHFESNMMNRERWVEKLNDPNCTFVVVDPIPDPFSLEHADLVLPSPPHPAATKLYQNGEWKLTLSVPQKQAPPETRSDPTIIYDSMAEISRRIRTNPAVAAANPDLVRHSEYMRMRFEAPEESTEPPITGPFSTNYLTDGLIRVDGEVSRPQLWERILNYMNGGKGRSGPLYCRFEHADGRLITWEEMLRKGSVIYGGVGTTRFRLDYDAPDHHPFGDLFQRPGKFKFFSPTQVDLQIPEGIILNSGRSALSDDSKKIRFAIASFNSGKGTPLIGMPDENILFVSQTLAQQIGMQQGDRIRVTNVDTGVSLVLPAEASDRVKGQACYISFHKCKAEIEEGRYINSVTSHIGRCPYSKQTKVKATQVTLEVVRTSQPAQVEHSFQQTVIMENPFANLSMKNFLKK